MPTRRAAPERRTTKRSLQRCARADFSERVADAQYEFSNLPGGLGMERSGRHDLRRLGWVHGRLGGQLARPFLCALFGGA